MTIKKKTRNQSTATKKTRGSEAEALEGSDKGQKQKYSSREN